MIIDLSEWLLDHWEEVTLNALLLFILRKFIFTELKRLLHFSRNDAILSNQKVIMRELGVDSEWTSHEHGLNFTALTNSKKWLPMFTRAMQKRKSILRRKQMLTNLFKTSLSKKLLALLVGAAVAALNKKLGLDLSPEEVVTFLIVIGGYILGQSHVDAQKVIAGIKDSPLLQMGFTEAKPILQGIHDGINSILEDVKKNDGSQTYKDAMQAYAQIKPILDALKHPEPVAVIVEDKVSA